jgi:hypothetical protein
MAAGRVYSKAVSIPRPCLFQGRVYEREGELVKATPIGIRDVAQGPLPGENGQPVHRRPDRVFDALAALAGEHTRVDQFVEYAAELAEGRAVRPRPLVSSAVAVLLWSCERSGEQARFPASELEVGETYRPQPAQGGGGIAVLAADAGDASGHSGGQLGHGGRGDRGAEFVMVGEVPIGGVGHDAHHPGRFTEHDRVGTTAPGQLEAGGDQAIAHGASRAPSRLRQVCFAG